MKRISTAERTWLANRAKGLGSSDAAAAIGESPWTSRLQLWARKRGLVPPPLYNEAMEWGHRLEAAVVRKFYDETGRRIENDGRYKIWQHPEHEWMIATLDRRQFREGDPRWGVLEIKTANAFAADDWKEGVPRLHFIQVQHSLAVTGAQWASIACLIGGQKFVWMDLERDNEFIDGTLIPGEWTFWQAVRDGIEPWADGSPSSSEALARMHPDANGEAVALPPEATVWDTTREDVNRQLAVLESAKAQLTNYLKQAIGEHERGTLPDGTYYTLKSNGKSRTLRRGRPKQ